MEVEVLVSTMNKNSISQAMELFKKMNITGKAVMINQITDSKIKQVVKEKGEKRIYSYYEKGLSKSRNKAIEKLNSEIGIFADDDVIYNKNYQEIIKKAYEKYPDADIIAFCVESTSEERKTRKQRTHKANYITLMRIQSFQITFRKDKIIQLDEQFGAGGKYKFGEENILLYDCKKQGKKIYYVNDKIGTVSHKTSTWYTKMDKEFLKCEGAVFYRINKMIYWILILQYAIRKRNEYKDNLKIKEAIKYLFNGAKEYKKSLTN